MDFGDLLNDTKIKEKLFNLHTNIDEIEKIINTALTKFDYEKLTPIEKANYDLFNVYSLNILCWMYMRTKGQDPNKTDIKGELVRIKNYMLKLKEVWMNFCILKFIFLCRISRCKIKNYDLKLINQPRNGLLSMV